MDVRCEKCNTEYEFDERRVGPAGVTVKCTACGFVFRVRHAEPSDAQKTGSLPSSTPSGREWLVRKPDAQMIAFRELTTLQKWIVEGRIRREDEISKNGETWKRLGNIMELEPFFSVYDKAAALNDLIDRGAMEGSRIELRGSEVLQTMSPLSNLPLTTPPAGALASAAVLATAASSPPAAVASLAAPSPAPPPAPPPSNLPAPSRGNGASLESLPRPEPEPSLGASRIPADHSSSHEGTGFPGPAALDGFPMAPGSSAAWSDHSIRLSRTPYENVRRASAKSSWMRAALVAVGIVIVGGAMGVFVAVFGPRGNPLQQLAERRGWLPVSPIDQSVLSLLDEARKASDQDTSPSLERADQILKQADALRPDDPSVLSERALVLIVRAAGLRTTAVDLEGSSPVDEVKLAESAERRRLASLLLKQAFELAAKAYKLSPESFGAARALAAYYAVQRDEPSFQREMARAKALIEKMGTIDAATLHVEAIAVAGDLAKPDPGQVDKAAIILDQALTTRPTLNRARVLLARLHLARDRKTLAQQEIERVIQDAPDHAEAHSLLSRLTETAPAPAETPKVEQVPAPGSPEKTPETRTTTNDGNKANDETKANDGTKAGDAPVSFEA